MSGTAKIEWKDVKKRFGPKVVLDGIDLTVNKGDSLVIIGGSGSGKSVTAFSILRLLPGLRSSSSAAARGSRCRISSGGASSGASISR